MQEFSCYPIVLQYVTPYYLGMTQTLNIRASWDEVKGEYAGHVEGLPEITLRGVTREGFEAVVEEAVDRLHLSHHANVIIEYGPRPATLDIAA